MNQICHNIIAYYLTSIQHIKYKIKDITRGYYLCADTLKKRESGLGIKDKSVSDQSMLL